MTGRHDYPELVEQKRPVPYWLDRTWTYIPAAAHGDSTAFAARQRERMERAAKERKQ